ncbi:hypothetical protein ACLKA6_000614 [Drosophila palustris]
MLSGNELELRPLEEATKIISGDKYCTASVVIPIVNIVKQKLQNLNGNTPEANEVNEFLLLEIDRRMGPMEQPNDNDIENLPPTSEISTNLNSFWDHHCQLAQSHNPNVDIDVEMSSYLRMPLTPFEAIARFRAQRNNLDRRIQKIVELTKHLEQPLYQQRFYLAPQQPPPPQQS